MPFSRDDAELFVPDDAEMPEALARTTHLCIGAHPDDQEFMAYHGIAACFNQPERWFTGVCVTDGAGSARSGVYEPYTDEQMVAIRRLEQRKAATVGEYAGEIQLGHPSRVVKDAAQTVVTEDLRHILIATQPDVVYLHNPADKHDTHVATLLRSVTAIRSLPRAQRPKKAYGVEIWRSLDWLVDEDKQVLNLDGHRNLASSLYGVFDSQITGAKRYDLASTGRQLSNATFFESQATDTAEHMTWAVDLTPLVEDDTLSVSDLIEQHIARFAEDVRQRLGKY
jgi:LmbE family N-acetylglucosaminyl deacetylase